MKGAVGLHEIEKQEIREKKHEVEIQAKQEEEVEAVEEGEKQESEGMWVQIEDGKLWIRVEAE